MMAQEPRGPQQWSNPPTERCGEAPGYLQVTVKYAWEPGVFNTDTYGRELQHQNSHVSGRSAHSHGRPGCTPEQGVQQPIEIGAVAWRSLTRYSIQPLLGYHAPHPTPRLRAVARSAGYQMPVGVKHRLSCRCA